MSADRRLLASLSQNPVGQELRYPIVQMGKLSLREGQLARGVRIRSEGWDLNPGLLNPLEVQASWLPPSRGSG